MESKPYVAKRELKQNLWNLFSIPEERRAGLEGEALTARMESFLDKRVEGLDEDAKRGESVAELIGWRVLAGGKYESFEGLIKAGLDEETALTVTAALDRLEPQAGKESVSALQKYQTIGSLTLTEQERGQALKALMSASAYGKYQTARGTGISARAYCDFLAQIATYTGNGKQKRVWAYINRLPISDRQKDALHYAAGYTESSLGKTPRH